MGGRRVGRLPLVVAIADARPHCLDHAVIASNVTHEYGLQAAVVLRDGPNAPHGAGSDRDRLDRARSYRNRLNRNCLLLVHGRPDLAVLAEADGVHLPGRGLPTGEVRQHWPSLIVGRSVHDAPSLRDAGAPEYVFLSPFANTPEKGPPLEPSVFAALSSSVPYPVVALGGITHQNAEAALGLGASGVAMIRELMDTNLDADGVTRAAHRLCAAVRTGSRSS